MVNFKADTKRAYRGQGALQGDMREYLKDSKVV